MENKAKQVHMNGWAMIAHASRRTSTGKWTLSISSIRNGDDYRPDWDDADNSYASEDDAYQAAEKWAKRALK